MTFDDLSKLRNAQPFRPFRLVLSDGRKMLVRAPEKIGWHAAGRLFTVYTQGDTSYTLDIGSISDVKPGARHASNGRSKS